MASLHLEAQPSSSFSSPTRLPSKKASSPTLASLSRYPLPLSHSITHTLTPHPTHTLTSPLTHYTLTHSLTTHSHTHTHHSLITHTLTHYSLTHSSLTHSSLTHPPLLSLTTLHRHWFAWEIRLVCCLHNNVYILLLFNKYIVALFKWSKVEGSCECAVSVEVEGLWVGVVVMCDVV
jgi:hypothetical protein